MLKTSDSPLEWFGVSVRGRAHINQKRPNEDAWMAMTGAFGTAIVVSDGMGSKPNARIGSQMACRAVKDALKPWAKSKEAPVTTLIRLIHLFWGLRILPATEDSSAATCLFAAVVPSGELTIAQLGDGIAALRHSDGTLEILQGERQGFTNETTALGVAKTTKDWLLVRKPNLSIGSALLLATDGIADDLVKESIGDFIHTLVTEFGPMSPSARRQALRNELKNWSTPKHLDDKTLAVLWRKQI